LNNPQSRLYTPSTSNPRRSARSVSTHSGVCSFVSSSSVHGSFSSRKSSDSGTRPGEERIAPHQGLSGAGLGGVFGTGICRTRCRATAFFDTFISAAVSGRSPKDQQVNRLHDGGQLWFPRRGFVSPPNLLRIREDSIWPRRNPPRRISLPRRLTNPGQASDR
jgi:hypothetical protein